MEFRRFHRDIRSYEVIHDFKNRASRFYRSPRSSVGESVVCGRKPRLADKGPVRVGSRCLLKQGPCETPTRGLENALKAHGEINACVSVTDNGRSYSPDCPRGGTDYRVSVCKAKGNTGVRAAIYFEQGRMLGKALVFMWIEMCLAVAAILALTNLAAGFLIQTFSTEVSLLLSPSGTNEQTEIYSNKLIAWILDRVGVAGRIREKAGFLHGQIHDYKNRMALDLVARARVEERSKNSEIYIERVKQIRHDIRSPLSSLQAIYEKLKSDDVATTGALATAIRRIQLLMDDLNQVDQVPEEPRLVIAEVVIEECALLMRGKFQESKSASLSVKFSNDSLSPIKVGHAGFQSIIENLLENSLDAISLAAKQW